MPTVATPGPVAALNALDRQAHRHPEDTVARLEALIRRSTPSDIWYGPALALEGVLRSQLRQSEAAARTAQALDALVGSWRDASAAAALVRAILMAREGSIPQAKELAQDALASMSAQAPASMRWRTLMLLAYAHTSLGQAQASTRLYLQAQDLAQTMGGSFAVLTAIHHAQAMLTAGQVEAGQQLLHSAHQQALHLDDAYALAQVLLVQTHYDTVLQQPAALEQHLREALEHARLSGSKRQLALSLANLAEARLRAGHVEPSLRLALEARSLGDPDTQTMLDVSVGTALIRLHRLAEGMRQVQRALDASQARGHVAAQAGYRLNLADALENAGYLREAVRVLQDQRKLDFEVAQRAQQRALLELQEAHAAESRLRELDLLERDNALKLQAVEQANRMVRVGVAGATLAAGLLVAAIGLLVRLRRRMRVLRALHERLHCSASHDALTGLPNRRRLQDLLRDPSAAVWQQDTALLMVDLDHFKQINDVRGHAAGDAVLVEVGRRLQALMRPQDVLLRWGGEEFLMMAPGLDPSGTAMLARRVLWAVGGQAMSVTGTPLRVTASVGHCQLRAAPDQRARHFEQALATADAALYRAKSQGRNSAWGASSIDHEAMNAAAQQAA